MLWLVLIVSGFLSGSIMYASLIPRLIAKKDVCELSDDGNPGTFNAFKHCGKAVGTACLLLDLLKGFVPVFLAQIFLDVNNYLFILVLLAPVAGHAVGLTNRFRGGKCIATSFGVLLGLIPATFAVFILAAFYVLFSTVFKIGSHAKRSIVTYALFASVAFTTLVIEGLVALACACVAVALLVMIRHIRFGTAKKGVEASHEEKL